MSRGGYFLLGGGGQSVGITAGTVAAGDDPALDSLHNVRRSGAVKGNNTADDTTALQAVIDASPAGSTVFFPPGTYLISAPLRLKAGGRRYLGGGHARGYGAQIQLKSGTNLINPAGGVTGMLVPPNWWTDAADCDGQILIENLYVNGNKDNNPSSTACGIILMNFWSQVRGCLVESTPAHGILQTDTTADGVNVIGNSASECDIIDNKITASGGCGYKQISANNNSNMDGNLIDNRISYVGESGVDFGRAAGWTIDNNHLYGITESGIVAGGCYATRITNNYVEDFGAAAVDGAYYSGIYASLLDGRGTQVTGNNVSGSELGADSNYRYITVNANTGQANVHAVVADNIIGGPGSGSGMGIVVQHSSGGVATVQRANNRVTGVTTPYYTAGGDTVTDPQAPVAAARKYKSSTTTATSSVQQDVVLGTVNFNRDPGVLDTGTTNAITVLVDGLYLVTADIAFTGGTAGYRGLLLLVNGSLVRENGLDNATECRPSIVATISLAAGDVVSMATYVTGGTPPDILASSSKDTALALTRLGN